MEPILILAVQWGGNYSILTRYPSPGAVAQGAAGFTYYSDKEITDDSGNTRAKGVILDVSSFNSSLNFDGNGTSSSLDITLDDSSGEFMHYFIASNMHKKPAYLFIWYADKPLNSMSCIFEGEIVSPTVWSDADRTFKVTIMTKIEHIDIGFTPDQGGFARIDPNMLGKAWPLGFGTVIKAPAVQITKAPTAITLEPMGLHDWSLNRESDRLNLLWGTYLGIATVYYLAALQAYFSDDKSLGDQMTDLGNQAITIMQDILSGKGDVDIVLQAQLQYEKNVTKVISDNPHTLPLGSQSNTSGDGTFKEFDEKSIILPSKASLINQSTSADGGKFLIDDAIYIGYLSASSHGLARLTINAAYHPAVKDPGLPQNDGPPPKGSFVFIQAGSRVLYQGDYPIIYVVNLLSSTVLGVYAYRTFEGLRRITKVPKSYYNISHLSTFDGSADNVYPPQWNATTIVLKRPLSTYYNENWDDQLYVTYTANPQSFKSVLNFIINTYSAYGIGESFASIPDQPVNFVLYEQKDFMTFIQELCWQNKTAVWIKDGELQFKYLPQFQTATTILTFDHILDGTFQITFSDTEKIVTKMTASWTLDYSAKDSGYLYTSLSNQIVVRYNEYLYGIHEENRDVYAFNNPNQVRAALSYWLYHMGNSWIQVSFKLPLSFLYLSNFDTLELSGEVCIAYGLGSTSITGTIISAIINPVDYVVEINMELPITIGNTSNFYWSEGPIPWAQALEFDKIPKLTGWSGIEPKFVYLSQFQAIDMYNKNPQSGGGGGSSSEDDGHLPEPDILSGDFPLLGRKILNDRGDVMGQIQDQSLNVSSDDGNLDIKPDVVPSFQYAYSNYNQGIKDNSTPTKCMPGYVIAYKGNNLYRCKIYPSGATQTGYEVDATLLQNENKNTDLVPEKTAALFSQTSHKNEDDDIVQEYWFQVPLWLG